jgi:pantothenate synthetase
LLAVIGVQTVRLDAAQAAVTHRDLVISELKRADAEALAAAVQNARTQEQAKSADSTRIAADATRKLQDVSARAADAQRAVVSLRDLVARLNARPVPQGADAAGYAREATAARQLLDECSGRYRDLAAQADELRVQVIGLIEWANGPGGAGQ